ncbi:DHA2 family efflux MFS transporter permease subunit [Streptomyces sulphureus]|uniref:DHA2 family efflux MFS transporter permease subunit n=1 Tax=Streptomyces sulphureus TaxID=47758 RepID=UPI0003697BA8|nr:DHA2 family efflux MFS transporter permease subunit [Streptomyces sulphureus]
MKDDDAVRAEPYGKRWWALSALVLSLLVIGLDITILNVALPTLATDLGAKNRELQWIADSYTLVFAGLLLPAGVLGDRFGRKKMIMAGLVIFGVASAWCAWSTGPTELIYARGLLGLGAAIVTPLSLSILPAMFPEEERGKAIAIWSTGTVLGLPLGPILGGYLLEHFWWGSVFLINVPVLAAGLLCAAYLLPESRDPAKPGVDLVGGVLSTAGLCSLLYGIIEGPDKGWSDVTILGTIAVGLLVLAVFVLWERRSGRPLIDLGLFWNRRFAVATLSLTVLSFVLYGILFVAPQYLQVVLESSALGSGVRLLPLVGAYMVGAGVSDALVKRIGARWVTGGGLVILGVGMAVMAGISSESGYAHTVWAFSVLGVGLGISLPPSVEMVMAVLPPGEMGRGTALTTALRQVGGALGIAVLGSMLASSYSNGVEEAARSAPSQVQAQVEDSVAAASAVADRMGESGEALRATAYKAFTDGMASLSLLCSIVALLGASVIILLLAKRGGEESGQRPVNEGSEGSSADLRA